MIKALALSAVLIAVVGIGIPLASNYAEASSKPYSSKIRKSKYKKYSKAWWRQYRDRQKKKALLASKKRSLRLRQIRLAKMTKPTQSNSVDPGTLITSEENLPSSWILTGNSSNSVNYKIDASGRQIANASLTVVGPSEGEDVPTLGRNKFLAGVSISSLRRIAINQVFKEGGWITNDFEKQLDGKRIYIVVAQVPAILGSDQHKTFYFAEAEGKIYALTTHSLPEDASRINLQSEMVVKLLQNPVGSIRTAKK